MKFNTAPTPATMPSQTRLTIQSEAPSFTSKPHCSPSTPLPPSASESLLNKLSTKSIVQFPTNPTVKKHFLAKFADECDSAAVNLQAAALPAESLQQE